MLSLLPLIALAFSVPQPLATNATTNATQREGWGGSTGGSMDCGGAPLCGVIVLETGLGSGNYKHDSPCVHGLWPQVKPYGTSQCKKPSGSAANPTKVYTCYNTQDSPSDSLSFEIHEFGKHGTCAGIIDADDFFGQICDLAKAPLKVVASSRKVGGDLTAMAAAVTKAGYTVFDTDAGNSQLQLSGCAGSDGKWQFADPGQFASICS